MAWPTPGRGCGSGGGRAVRDPRPVAEVLAAHGVAAAIGLKHVASLLFTYRCTLSCKHCCFYCSPRRPARRTRLEDAVEWLAQLHTTDRVIHIAGGEAMLYWDELSAICAEAGRRGVAPHFIETNATFATSDAIVRDRLRRLQDCGVLGLLISADPYHQRLCPPERVERCTRIAREVFGAHNVIGGSTDLAVLQSLRAVSRDEARLAEYTVRHPPLLSGRAGDELAMYFPPRPMDALLDTMWHGGGGTRDCRQEFDPDTMWELHVDPYGNIQTCCLIIVGNVRERPLREWMLSGFLGRNEIVDAVYAEGPFGLLELARKRGYEARDAYPQKCGLCWEVRKYLRPFYPDVLGPPEVYEPDPSD